MVVAHLDVPRVLELHRFGGRRDIVEHLMGWNPRAPRLDWWGEVWPLQAHLHLEALCALGNAHAPWFLRRAPDDSVVFVATLLRKRVADMEPYELVLVSAGLRMVSREMRRRGYSRALRVALLGVHRRR